MPVRFARRTLPLVAGILLALALGGCSVDSSSAVWDGARWNQSSWR